MQRGPPPPRASSVPSMVITVRCLASVQSSKARKLTAGTTRKPAACELTERRVVAAVAHDRARAAPRGSCRPSSTARAPGWCGAGRRRTPAPAAGPPRAGRRRSSGISRTPSPPLRRCSTASRSGPDEVRRVDHAELAVHLGEDHVEMDRGGRLRHHDHDDVGDRALREERLAQLVERRRRGALAEAHHQQVGPEVVHVPALERVVAAPLLRAVVEQPVVGQLGVEAEQRLDQQLLGPAHVVAHRADHHVAADHHADVAGEEEVGQRREGEALLVERPGDRARSPRGCPRSASRRSAPAAACRAAGPARPRRPRPSSW